MKIKADLGVYAGIGFQKYWRFAQGTLAGNLTSKIINQADSKNIKLIGVMSANEGEILENSVHDRYSFLWNEAQKIDYTKTERDGNLFRIIAKSKPYAFLNAQKVVTQDKDIRGDFIALGTNQIPSNLSLENALNECEKKNAIPLLTTSCPFYNLDKSLINDVQKFTGIVYDSEAGIEQEKDAKKIAETNNISAFPISKSHRIPSIGKSYIEFDNSLIDLSSEKRALNSLRNILSNSKNFDSYIERENTFEGLRWKGPLGLWIIGHEIIGKRLSGIKRKSAL